MEKGLPDWNLFCHFEIFILPTAKTVKITLVCQVMRGMSLAFQKTKGATIDNLYRNFNLLTNVAICLMNINPNFLIDA